MLAELDTHNTVIEHLPQETPHNMFQEPDSLTLLKLNYHITQHSAHSIEPLVRLADVVEAHVVQQDLLDDEYCYCFREFRTCFHDAQAEGYDLGGK